jgi:hypothetical protein
MESLNINLYLMIYSGGYFVTITSEVQFMQDNQRQAFTRREILPYCAGLIDGDGSICIVKGSPKNKNWDISIRKNGIAYFSGLFDTEGSFSVQKCDLSNVLKKFKRISPIYSGKVRIGMVSKEPLFLLDKTFPGGRVLCEGVRKDRPTYQIMYRWEMCRKDLIISMILEMMPFLIVKREQAHILLDFLQKWKNPFNRKLGLDPEELQRREEAYLKMRKLNAVGAAATTNSQSIREDEVIV